MNCRDYEALCSASVDGELSAEEELALRAHLQSCESCRAYRQALLSLSDALRADVPAPPPELTENILDAIRAQDPAPKRRARIHPFPRRIQGLAAAAAVFVLLAGYAGARLFQPKGAMRSAAAEAPREQEMLRFGAASAQVPEAPAAAPAAGIEESAVAMDAEEAETSGTMQYSIMSMDAGPAVPFILRSADGSERQGPDCGVLWTIGEETQAPAPDRGPDARILDPEGELLWQLWEEEDAVLFQAGEGGPIFRAESGVFWDALGELE